MARNLKKTEPTIDVNSLKSGRIKEFNDPMLNMDDFLEDIVNHPNHYKSEGEGNIECIDAIQSALSAEEFQGFCKGNAIKYTWRANRKQDARTNLEKCRWYINKLLDNLI